MCKFKLAQLARKHAKEQPELADRWLDIFDREVVDYDTCKTAAVITYIIVI